MNSFRLSRFLPAFAALAMLPACDARKPSASTDVAGAPPPGIPVAVAQATPIPTTALDPSADLSAAIKDATYLTRDTLKTVRDRFEQRVETDLAVLKANGADVDVDAEKKVTDARTNVTKSLNDLADAPPETWPTAQSRALAALQEFRSAWTALKSGRATS